MMESQEVLLLVKDKNLYFFPFLQSVHTDAVLRKHSRWSRFIEKLVIHYHLPLEGLIFGHWRKELSNYQLVIFLDYGFEPYMADYLKRHSTKRTILFLWNHIVPLKEELIKNVKNHGTIDDIYSFDAIDAKRHQLKHNSTFYTKNFPTKQVEPIYDITFFAADNGRSAKAKELQQYLDGLNLVTYFHIVAKSGNEDANYLSYTDYMDYIFKSKCLLEIQRAGQTGLTLRTLEAIYFEKKLITNNEAIKHYRFYNPNNIFLLGEDDLSTLKDFITSDFQPLAPDIKAFFEVDNWLERFQAGNEDEGFPEEIVLPQDFDLLKPINQL